VAGSRSTSLRGRQAEARRNDERILEAALEVFTADQRAPMSAVAERAGVGQASLYRRYPNKDALLSQVAERGMRRIREAALEAIESPGDAWDALTGFLRRYLESETPRLVGLLGAFAPEEHLYELAHETNEAMQALVERTAKAGRLREDVTGADLTLIVTQISSLEAAGAERTAALRDRYLTLVLQSLALRDAPELPGPAPDAAELEQPWREQQRLSQVDS
jgi:AcrR family transcriptional regulator